MASAERSELPTAWFVATRAIQNVAEGYRKCGARIRVSAFSKPRLIYLSGELAADHTLDFYSKEYVRLQDQLEDAAAKSSLPKQPSGQGNLNELLLTLRTDGWLSKTSA